MPNLKASIKDVRKTKKRTARNTALKRRAKDAVKKIASASGKDKKELLASAYKAIDKAVKAGVFHRNKAARKKAQIAKIILS